MYTVYTCCSWLSLNFFSFFFWKEEERGLTTLKEGIRQTVARRVIRNYAEKTRPEDDEGDVDFFKKLLTAKES